MRNTYVSFFAIRLALLLQAAGERGTISELLSLLSSEQTVLGKVVVVATKLGIGDTFPRITLNLVDGSTLELPDGIDAKYRILLFYRGHW